MKSEFHPLKMESGGKDCMLKHNAIQKYSLIFWKKSSNNLGKEAISTWTMKLTRKLTRLETSKKMMIQASELLKEGHISGLWSAWEDEANMMFGYILEDKRGCDWLYYDPLQAIDEGPKGM